MIEVPEAVVERLAADAKKANEGIAAGHPAYGANRGVGSGRRDHLDESEGLEQSRRLLAYGSDFHGEAYPEFVTRAALLLRARSLVAGRPGCSPWVLDRFVQAFNDGLALDVFRSGSVGASDLGEMGQVARGLLAGQGPDVGDEAFGPRDALALVSSSAVTLADAVLLLLESADLMELAQEVVAGTIAGFGGNPSPFSAPSLDVRANESERTVGADIERRIRDLAPDAVPRDVQDPLSFRCAGMVNAALLEAIHLTRGTLEGRINGSDDNPTVDGETGLLVSTANFDTTVLAAAVDFLSAAALRVAVLSVERISKIQWPEFAGADTGRPGGNGRGAAGLLAAMRSSHGSPSVAFSGQVSCGVEDWSSLLPQSVLACRRNLSGASEILEMERQLYAGEPPGPTGRGGGAGPLPGATGGRWLAGDVGGAD